MEVGGVVDGGGEDAHAVLALGLAVELLPPFGEVGELRVVVDKDLHFLAVFLIKEIPHRGVHDGGILRGLHGKGLLGLEGAGEDGTHVESGHHDGQDAHGGEDGEAAAHVVRDDEGLVAFLGGEGLEGALLGVGDGDDALGRLLLAVGVLQVLLHDAEGDGGLGGGAGLGDDDAGDIALGGQVHEFGEVFLGQVVAGEDDLGGVLLRELLREVVAEGLDRALGAEVGTADADGDHQVHALGLPVVADRLAIRNQAFGGLGRQVLPTQEVIAGAVSGDEDIESIEGLAHIRIKLGSIHEAAATFNVYFYHD